MPTIKRRANNKNQFGTAAYQGFLFFPPASACKPNLRNSIELCHKIADDDNDERSRDRKRERERGESVANCQ